MLKEVTNSLYFDYYRENIFVLEAVTEFLTERINDIEKKREEMGRRKLSDSVRYRIKSPESMQKKLRLRGFDTDASSAMKNVYDAVGIRIICPYIDDVYSMAQELFMCSDIKVIEVKDYIKEPKENGYRSYHMIVRVPVRINGQTVFSTAEIQIRSIIMNSWAVAEHQLKYKKDTSDEKSKNLLKKCADEMLKIDYSMMRIRDMMQA